MKILYISIPMEDYQGDSIFHGLRSLYGDDVVDYKKLSHMYVGADKSKLYGKGFTLFGNLEDIQIDRDDITNKIKSKFFDLVIIGDVYRWDDNDLLSMVDIFDYPASRMIFIDGMDAPQAANKFCNNYKECLLGKGIYFRSNIDGDNPEGLIPIDFAIPKEKVLSLETKTRKIYDFAPLIPAPAHQDTYIYDDESEYYEDYASSWFAYTSRKGQWNTMRTLEIMACGAIPYFLDIEMCPLYTLTNLPKDLLIEAKYINGVYPGISLTNRSGRYFGYPNYGDHAGNLINQRSTIYFKKFDYDKYYNIRRKLHKYLLMNLTTEAAAKRLIMKVRS